MSALVSAKGLEMIVHHEISSEAYYEKKLKRPTWPGGASGITIGIGYDIGASISTRAELERDWGAHLSRAAINDLSVAIGIQGTRARPFVAQLRHVEVPLAAAKAVFEKTSVPRYYAMAQKALPHFEELPLDCKAALLSLVFNRGASFSKEGDRYAEMNNIKTHMINGDWVWIPDEIRSMKRLWEGQNLDGLLKRRDDEADLFQEGLDSQE